MSLLFLKERVIEMNHLWKFPLCLILVSLFCSFHASAMHFSDVPEDHWAYSDIAAMETRGIIEGSDGRFRPNAPVSNQAFLAMVCRASGMDDRALETRWSAAPIMAYGRYLEWFSAEELTQENAGAPITREFAAKLLVKAFFPEEISCDSHLSFTDTRRIAHGHLDYVKIAVNQSLITGYSDGSFRPKGQLTRAAAAALLNRALEQTESSVSGPSMQIPILMYHDISYLGHGYSKTPEQFHAQMLELKNAGFQSVTYQQLVDFVEQGTPLPEKPIVITLDDGYRSNYEYVFPILRELEMKAEISLIGGAIQYSDWGMNWSEIQEMAESGVISFQAHTYLMHSDQSAAGGQLGVLKAPRQSWQDYVEGLGADTERILDTLENRLGVRPIAFTYPRGKWNNLAEGLVTRLGCKVSVTTKEGIAYITVGDPSSLHLMDRIGMDFRNGSVINVLEQFGYQA